MPRRDLVLDTCAVLWLASGGGRLSERAMRSIDVADKVFVSAISAWEIGLKQERGALSLPMPAESWFPSVLERHHLLLAPLTLDILMAANRLPWHHRDPADRFILATAIAHRAAVVTADRMFASYDEVEILG